MRRDRRRLDGLIKILTHTKMMEKDETLLMHGAKDKPSHYGATGAPRHAEVAAAMPPGIWIEKSPATGFLTYPKRNQGLAGDCVEYAYAKAIAVDFLNITGVWRELSPHSVYPFVFEPGGGSDSLIVGATVSKIGMTFESLFTSDNLTEAQAESPAGYAADAKQVALLYRVPNVIQCNADFETIASILQAYKNLGKKKVVMVTIIGKNNGTWYSEMPQIPGGPVDASRSDVWLHKVPVTDFGLINGQKVLAIDQSWGTVPGNGGQQFLTEAYAPWIYGGLYTVDPVAVPTTDPLPPTYQWNANLAVGSSGPDVLALQQALQSMGMFPVSAVVGCTGAYYGITKAAVQLFQSSFGLPDTGIVDAGTRAKLNGIFNS